MAKATIQIHNVFEVEKRDKTGFYTACKCSLGDKIGIFEKSVIEGLKECVGGYAVVEYERRPNGYINITRYYGKGENPDPVYTSNNGADTMPTAERVIKQVQADEHTEVLKGNVVQVKPAITERVIHEIQDNTKRNWVEVGKAGERMKIYFDNEKDLKEQLMTYYRTVRTVLNYVDGTTKESTTDE